MQLGSHFWRGTYPIKGRRIQFQFISKVPILEPGTTCLILALSCLSTARTVHRFFHRVISSLSPGKPPACDGGSGLRSGRQNSILRRANLNLPGLPERLHEDFKSRRKKQNLQGTVSRYVASSNMITLVILSCTISAVSLHNLRACFWAVHRPSLSLLMHKGYLVRDGEIQSPREQR